MVMESGVLQWLEKVVVCIAVVGWVVVVWCVCVSVVGEGDDVYFSG